MNKFLNKWFRKIHRWIAVPTALLIPAAFIIKLIGNSDVISFWERLDKLPSLLMLLMAVTGSYLYLLPYFVKQQRQVKAIPRKVNHETAAQ